MATTQDYINQLKVDKQNLVTMLNNMGVEATDNETFTSLTPKVGKIVTEPILQDKSITITENGTTNITADEGYDGLNNVEVTTNITTGDTIEKAMIINECNEKGNPTKVSFIGITKIHSYAMGNSSLSTAKTQVGVDVKNIEMDDTVETIGEYAFGQCQSLETIKLSKALTSIGVGMCVNCPKLKLKTIPDNVTSLGYNSFGYCTSIIQMSLLNVTQLYNGGSFAFHDTSLKALWLGSQIPDSGFDNNTFKSSKKLETIFIDLPRATIETYTYYSIKWGAPDATIIICNDDEGFMTKEEFDAIDWATYTS